jgi:hypothetical protein
MQSNKFHNIASSKSQHGAVLIFIIFIIGLVLTALVIKGFDAASMKIRHGDVKTRGSLVEAKEALIAWSVGHKHTPGIFPWPDRNGDGNYDGSSDCATNSFAWSLFLGRLPSMPATNPCYDPNTGLNVYSGYSTYPGVGQEFTDSSGNQFWYVVSRNVVRDNQAAKNPIINPAVANVDESKVLPYDGTPTTSAYPWLVVRNAAGQIVSDRVAAVIIAPGPALNGQDRSSTAPPPSSYLDSITIEGKTYANYAYTDGNGVVTDAAEFIMADISTDSFNDRLIYITIDELIYALEKRVLMETKNALNVYYDANGHFPFAAGIGASNPNQCVKGNLRGLLPTSAPTSRVCSCDTAVDEVSGIPSSCNCHFSIASSVAFKRNADVFVATGAAENAPFGSCLVDNSDPTICSCNGAGGCKSSSGETVFLCNACGICTSTVAGEYTFTTGGKFETPTGTCALNPDNTVASCTNDALGEFHLEQCMAIERLLGLPIWFQDNQWQDYIFYELSTNCSSSGANCLTAMPQLTVGEKDGVRALVASPGPEFPTAPFAASKGTVQSIRPSCDLKDFLDSIENTNQVMANGTQDAVYQPTQRRTNSHNDQVVIVAP